MTKYYSNGKLLITAEYLVLDGAEALALPTTLGQSLQIESNKEQKIKWTSLDYKNLPWLDTAFHFENSNLICEDKNDLTKRLAEILNTAKTLNPEFLKDNKGYAITTKLGFPQNWGLGTSSTLINNVASWAKVNPYTLLELTFGGSGYDIACASNNSPITFKLQEETPAVTPVVFNPDFKDQLYFVHLNEKQNSRDGIAAYRKNTKDKRHTITKINEITGNIISCDSIDDFNSLINEHENIISEIIQLTPVKSRLFPDFQGSIKSLGAWGGDFILVSAKNNPTPYFKNKGYNTILRYDDMIL
ncbi:GYDIA family GHMP kinase [Formosa sp. S-31]|uniref:GYDIA family GHMP kinase n=1 Tax=Formosa sp. S-31 TaxID=2790949 RepID=UPI003EBEE128